MKHKTVFWLAVFALLAAAGTGMYLLRGGSGTVAVLTVDGEVVDTVDLAAVAVPYEKTVETPWGQNTVRFSHGAVAVISADCPDKLCVEQGTIEDSAIPIVCLPHRLVITIADE